MIPKVTRLALKPVDIQTLYMDKPLIIKLRKRPLSMQISKTSQLELANWVHKVMIRHKYKLLSRIENWLATRITSRIQIQCKT